MRCDPWIAAQDGEPPWSTKEFVRIVCEIQHWVGVSSAIVETKSWYSHPPEWKNKNINPIEEATEVSMAELIP